MKTTEKKQVKQGVTVKTLKALKEQTEKVIEEKLLSEEQGAEMRKLLEEARKNWIEKNM